MSGLKSSFAQMAVERVGQVGHHDRVEVKGLDQLLEDLQVADAQQRPASTLTRPRRAGGRPADAVPGPARQSARERRRRNPTRSSRIVGRVDRDDADVG